MCECAWCNLSEEESKWLLLDNDSWSVYLADEQDYIGRCILVLKRHCGSLAELTDDEFTELKHLICRLEYCLKSVLGATLCNWSCLLNDFYKKDEPAPHLHLHVRPRYRSPIILNGVSYSDEEFGHHYDPKKGSVIRNSDFLVLYNTLRDALLQKETKLNQEEYLANPCRTASIPYWKAIRMQIPENMRIIHDEAFYEDLLDGYIDKPYFRLKHDLIDLAAPQLPDGFAVCEATCKEYAEHICSCYSDIGISEMELQSCTQRKVYCLNLWLAVCDKTTGEIVATGIAELDREIHEGVLEWIQVSPGYRGRGLGKFLVLELLRRMKPTAEFATVSGQCNNPTSPEELYRKCGFTGHDVWHILRRKAHD